MAKSEITAVFKAQSRQVRWVIVCYLARAKGLRPSCILCLLQSILNVEIHRWLGGVI